ncbi:MAG TPA: cyclic nucleotide-binding domain-containing protein [Aeromicrobium sp.]|nr:cyclic nucleotide-binding domain-containing protein [Aeromicrobium sp.]
MAYRPHIEPEAVALLKSLTTLSDTEVNKFAEVGRLVHILEGWSMISESTPADNAYFILDGQVIVKADGKEIATVGPGEFVGEGAIVNRTYRSAQVITKTPLTALAITADEGRRLAADIPALGALIQKEATDRSSSD